MAGPVRAIPAPAGERSIDDTVLSREWLATNGLGGYASGTVVGVPTRKYHGLLVAALKAPFGRTVMLNNLFQTIILPDGSTHDLCCERQEAATAVPFEFRLEMRFPVWRYRIKEAVIERRIYLSYRQNTVHITYTLLSGDDALSIRLTPGVHFRQHDSPVNIPMRAPYLLALTERGVEIWDRSDLPPLRLRALGDNSTFVPRERETTEILYSMEARRGYESTGSLWLPGAFSMDLRPGETVSLTASTEPWEIANALTPEQALETERERRRLLIAAAGAAWSETPIPELALAADQFIFSPLSRPEDAARARAAGEELLSIIAGYHWFSDWGRDTMISLEGLALVSGRADAAGWILRTFAHYVRNGLIPNMFPEGSKEGRYNTADATLWFFHAIGRSLEFRNDPSLLSAMVPTLLEIIDHHVYGTDFGIRMDPADGLLTQGAEGYPLTWMDAKVGEWVVTPRRGKAVEINALWYNALRLLEGWLHDRKGEEAATRVSRLADRVYESFNRRFWFEGGGYLYDVIDGENGDDRSCRPNQIFAISLPHPVLDPRFWSGVMMVVEEKLLTPVGLRSLSPDDPQYKSRCDGDLHARDAAYHQGTVWGWLIGPFVDAWMRVHPDRECEARTFLSGLAAHLDEACVGSMSEIFDAEPPFTPRGCVAQAWTVAEFFRAWVKTEERAAAAPQVEGSFVAGIQAPLLRRRRKDAS